MKIIPLLTSAALAFHGFTGHCAEEPAAPQPRVQIAILLDTSSSMDGLIAQAKTQLWNIVNEFALAKQNGQAPRVEVALYEYGNSGLDAKTGWVRQVAPLTDDLDKLSESLFALKTNGGEEWCGWVIRDATRDLKWDDSPKTYKAIFIAGNEPFSQGSVPYAKSCKGAIGHGIIVNTIHCGSEKEGIDGKWKDGAALADGKFLVIDQNAQTVSIDAPQDKEIADLNTKLNATYIAYGREGATGRARQEAQDANAKPSASVAAQRIASKASANYSNSRWDLVDASKEKSFDWSKLPEAELPDELKKLPVEKRKEFVEAKQKERADVQEQIKKLSAEREKFVAQTLKEKAGTSTLGKAVTEAVRAQAAKKEFSFAK
jgi:hypothetical protein